MAEYIPFVNNPTDCEVLNSKIYADSDIIRVSLDSLQKLYDQIPSKSRLWVDPAVDAYHHILTQDWPIDILELSVNQIKKQWPVHSSGKKKGERQSQYKYRIWENWNGCFGDFRNHPLLAIPKRWVKAYCEDLNEFVFDVLNSCLKYDPEWLTVPQLPLVDSGQRNKINKLLALATAQWKNKERFDGTLVLPVLFTNHSQFKNKSTREKKLKDILKCYKTARAEAIWVVDTTLPSQPTNENCRKRYANLIKFHTSVSEQIGKQAIIISGPYWGLNLVLWVRGISDYPAISLGSRYTYNISCGSGMPPSNRISLPPLRRWVRVNNDLGTWLDKAMKKLAPSDVVYQELLQIRKNFSLLNTRKGSVNQTARFYKQWLDKISDIPQRGRKMALYQDLSSAFVAGSQLPVIPKKCEPYGTSEIRVPGKVAEQLMLSCF